MKPTTTPKDVDATDDDDGDDDNDVDGDGSGWLSFTPFSPLHLSRSISVLLCTNT